MNALGDTSARARPWASNCRNPKNVVSSGGAMKAPPTPKNPETTPPMTPTIVTQPQARLGPLSPLAPPPPRPISDGPGSGSEKDREGEPQACGSRPVAKRAVG